MSNTHTTHTAGHICSERYAVGSLAMIAKEINQCAVNGAKRYGPGSRLIVTLDHAVEYEQLNIHSITDALRRHLVIECAKSPTIRLDSLPADWEVHWKDSYGIKEYRIQGTIVYVVA